MGSVQLLFKTLTRMLKYSIGGTNSALFTGSITFTYALAIFTYFYSSERFELHSPITSTSPSNEFWGINESITYGTTTVLALTAGIVDTGASARKWR
jgi:cathepsin E